MPQCYSCERPIIPPEEGIELPILLLIQTSSEEKKEAITKKWQAAPVITPLPVHPHCIDDPSQLDWPDNPRHSHNWAIATIRRMQREINRLSRAASPADTGAERLFANLVIQIIAEESVSEELREQLRSPALDYEQAKDLAPSLEEAVKAAESWHNRTLPEMEELASETGRALPQEEREAIAQTALDNLQDGERQT